eukprot:TRINITY_DN2461_c0_g1_i1.p2 TRINITY_DN2461_c0_g1~~TRINITY_DN2461_c0_g1_i1.p2  ORF type:complete len:102 (-),score=25.04 TRINITY_DN2461_c0_g1_i1:48-308(-)
MTKNTNPSSALTRQTPTTASGNALVPRGAARPAAGKRHKSDVNSEQLRFFRDETPGLKLGPTAVLVVSVVFIAVVILLHIWGKFTK